MILCMAVACGSTQTVASGQQPGENTTVTKESAANSASVMCQAWAGPYGGVPPWHLVQPDQFVTAFDEAIATAQQEIEAIGNNPAPPTFENTIVALEKAGRSLDRLQSLFGVHASNLNLGPMPEIQRVVMPKLAEFQDRTTQNEKLFERIAAVYESDDLSLLNTAQQRLVEDHYKNFVRQGARLNAEDKTRLAKINKRLASLFADFSQHVLDDERDYVTWIDDEASLDGLPDSTRDAMAAAAAERGRSGQWAVTNTRSSMEPFLTYAAHRELREKVWRNYYSRGDHGDARDNNGIISEILKLRAVRAKLLGYETHAHWRLERQMAKTPEAAMDLMLKVWPKAVARVREEVADMQRIADEEGANIRIEPWDYRYYAEKVRKAKYDLDFNEVKPYLQLEKLREAMMWCAGQLYGLQFEPVQYVPVFHPDVRVWEVTNGSGQHVGLWYLDPYAREGKRSGAWMTDYRAQENMDQADFADRVQQLQLYQGSRRGAGADFLGRCGDHVSRVRPCVARPAIERELPLAVGNVGRPRLCRVSVAIE